MATTCIGWRCVGIAIGWLLFMPSTFLVLVIALFHGYHDVRFDFAISSIVINWWMNIGWLYGVTFYRPICMMVALIWWSLIGTCGLYYQARLIEFEIQQNRYEDLLWSVAHVLIVCGLFVCAACSYKSVQRSTAHLRRMAANPLSAVAYEVPVYQHSTPQ